MTTPLQVHLQEAEPTGEPGESPAVTVHAETSVAALKPLSSLVEATLQKSINELRSDLFNRLSDFKGEVGTKASELKVDVTQLQDKVDRWARSPARAKLASAGAVRSAPSARWVPPATPNRSTMAVREKAAAAAMGDAESVRCKDCKSPSTPDVPVRCASATGRARSEASRKDKLARSTGCLPELGKS